MFWHSTVSSASGASPDVPRRARRGKPSRRCGPGARGVGQRNCAVVWTYRVVASPGSPIIHVESIDTSRSIRTLTLRVESSRGAFVSNRTVRKAVIPAAGLGTRFLPATKAQPKEMLPVVDRPSIQYVVEEAVEAGIDDILIITGRNKRSIEDHFDRNFELEYQLNEKGKIARSRRGHRAGRSGPDPFRPPGQPARAGTRSLCGAAPRRRPTLRRPPG